jgi:hypothetical protein
MTIKATEDSVEREPWRTHDGAIEYCAIRYSIGSTWMHSCLGLVRVTGYVVAQSPEDSYCGVTYCASPRIQDSDGRTWSCYSPHVDLLQASAEGRQIAV